MPPATRLAAGPSNRYFCSSSSTISPPHTSLERDAAACIRRHQTFALPPVNSLDHVQPVKDAEVMLELNDWKALVGGLRSGGGASPIVR